MSVAKCPPKTIHINGTEYQIDYNFMTWIEISELGKEFDNTDDADAQENNAEVLIKIATLAFGRLIDEPAGDIITAVQSFLNGYPREDNGYSGDDESDTPIYSFKHDLDYIILAIRNQSGIDLTYRRKEPFHYWDFLLEFQTLEDRHYISKIMGYRAYKGEDKDLLKLKNAYALPKETTRFEQRLAKEMDDIFYNS